MAEWKPLDPNGVIFEKLKWALLGLTPEQKELDRFINLMMRPQGVQFATTNGMFAMAVTTSEIDGEFIEVAHVFNFAGDYDFADGERVHFNGDNGTFAVMMEMTIPISGEAADTAVSVSQVGLTNRDRQATLVETILRIIDGSIVDWVVPDSEPEWGSLEHATPVGNA